VSRLKWIAVLAAATVGASTAIGFAATLNVGTWHLWGGAQTLTKGTCTITAAGSIVDTYVRENSTTSSFGTATTMTTRVDSGLHNWSFVRFDLSSCALTNTAGADSATLKLVVKTTATGGRTLTVTPVLGTWDGTLTWNQAQTLSYGSSATTTFATGATNGATLSIPVTIDVDKQIKSSTAVYGWRISDLGSTATGNTTIFNTVEAGTASLRPQLVVNYEK
jgi:hypothetical protein